MPIINNPDDERAFAAYTAARNEVRAKMGHGVYPNCLVAIAAYEALEAALAEGGSLEQFAEYHNTLMAPLAPYIATLRADMVEIANIMYQIELIQPDTFGIPLDPPPPTGPQLGRPQGDPQ